MSTHLEAGRELDALIAEKVMGWDPADFTWVAVRYGRPQPDNTCPMSSFGLPSPLRIVQAKCDRENGRHSAAMLAEIGRYAPEVANVPGYSQDIAAAWEVVEKIGRPRRNVVVEQRGSGDYYVLVENDDGVEAESEADTAPLAICRAALDLVMSPPVTHQPDVLEKAPDCNTSGER